MKSKIIPISDDHIWVIDAIWLDKFFIKPVILNSTISTSICFVPIFEH